MNGFCLCQVAVLVKKYKIYKPRNKKCYFLYRDKKKSTKKALSEDKLKENTVATKGRNDQHSSAKIVYMCKKNTEGYVLK